MMRWTLRPENSDDSVLDGFAEVSFSDFLHLEEHHGGDFLSLEFLDFTLELDNDHRLLVGTLLDLEGPQLDVVLNSLVRELAADEALGVEDGVDWVTGSLVLGSVTDETFLFSEGDV
jgi:hypothetical protein